MTVAYHNVTIAAHGTRPRLRRCRRFLFLSKRMNDEENDSDADAGIGHVECRPRARERHMQIEQQKINHVSVKQAVSQISEHAGEQERQGQIAPEIPRPPK